MPPIELSMAGTWLGLLRRTATILSPKPACCAMKRSLRWERIRLPGCGKRVVGMGLAAGKGF